MAENHFDFLVIGGGCMGISIARALTRKQKSKVALIEGVARSCASKSGSKIIRTPYFDSDYVALAIKAEEEWTRAPYAGFLQRTGWIQIVAGDYKPFFSYPTERCTSLTEASHMMPGKVPPTLGRDEKLWYCDRIYMAQAGPALEMDAQRMVDAGVKRIHDDISKLLFSDDKCQGAETIGGVEITSETVILAAGVWSLPIMERSGIKMSMEFGKFFTSTATSMATVELYPEDYEALDALPIMTNDLGEIIPDAVSKTLTITSTETFELSNLSELQNNVTEERRAKLDLQIQRLVPFFVGRPTKYWYCGDLITPQQHPLVGEVPGVTGFYLATGGSYHMYKFLPVFGDVVSNCLRGTKDGVSKKWSWSRSDELQDVHSEIVPRTLNS